MVIAYRQSPLSWALQRRMMYLPYVGMPNILAGEALVPELLQGKATPAALAAALLDLLRDTGRAAPPGGEVPRDSTSCCGRTPRRRRPTQCCGCSMPAARDAPRLLCGVDEAGRGPIAGPVFAAAVILDPRRPIAGLKDSKLLAPRRREALAITIRREARAWAVASATVRGDRPPQHPAGHAAGDAARGGSSSRCVPTKPGSTATTARG